MIGGTRREFRRGLLGAVPYMYIPSLASASQPAASPPTPSPAAPCSATTTTCDAHKPPPGPAFSTLGQPPPGSRCRRRLAPGRNVTGCASPEMRRASKGRGRASLLFRPRERGLRIANPLLKGPRRVSSARRIPMAFAFLRPLNPGWPPSRRPDRCSVPLSSRGGPR